jgi:AraC family transcriptional regulator
MEQRRTFEPARDGRAGGDRTPSEEIGLILDNPPVLIEGALGSGARLTRRWRHGAVHDSLPPMSDHVIMTYYGEEREITLQGAGRRIVSRTRPSSITIIPSGADGRWDVAGAIEVSHVYLPASRLEPIAEVLAKGRRVELLGRVAFDDPVAARILELLSRESAANDASSRLFVEQAIDLLCTQLIRGHSSVGALPEPEVKRGLAPWQIKRVTEYMLERIGEELSLNELAGILHLSRFHFCTAFRQATGKTPHEWLVLQRIRFAKKLLEDRLLSVTEVGLSVGYGTPSAFAAAFRKVVGVTPTEFRRSL